MNRLAWPIAALLLALLPAGGCGGKPAPTPPGAEKTTPAPEIDLGNSSDTPADEPSGGGPAKDAAKSAPGTPIDEQPEDSDTEKDK